MRERAPAPPPCRRESAPPELCGAQRESIASTPVCRRERESLCVAKRERASIWHLCVGERGGPMCCKENEGERVRSAETVLSTGRSVTRCGKFSPLWTKVKISENFLMVYLVFGNILNQLVQNFVFWGKYSLW